MSIQFLLIEMSLLKPFLDVVKHVHWYGIHHGHFTMIVFENEDHIKILQMKLNTLEMNKLHVFQ